MLTHHTLRTLDVPALPHAAALLSFCAPFHSSHLDATLSAFEDGYGPADAVDALRDHMLCGCAAAASVAAAVTPDASPAELRALAALLVNAADALAAEARAVVVLTTPGSTAAACASIPDPVEACDVVHDAMQAPAC